MVHSSDTRTLPIDFVVPTATPEPVEGSMDYRVQVCCLVSQILKEAELDRYQVAAEMSRLVGRDVSKFMLDAWAAPGREDHNIPFYQVAVLEHVCKAHSLTDWHVDKRGGAVAYGRDVIKQELGKFMALRDELDRKVKELRKIAGEEQ